MAAQLRTSPKLLAAVALVGLLVLLTLALQIRGFGGSAPDPLPLPVVEPVVETAAPSPTPEPTPAALQLLDGRLQVESLLAPDRDLRHGDYAWNDDGVADGPLLIVVDVRAEVLHVFRGGVEIGRSVVLYGADDKPTPLGEFNITQKKKDHVSNLYDAPMPYMMRLTNDGIAIHGSEVESGYATHGCIGVPTEFAAILFGQAQLGTRVIITDKLDLDEPEEIASEAI